MGDAVRSSSTPSCAYKTASTAVFQHTDDSPHTTDEDLHYTMMFVVLQISS
jgi:hypothetical protein